MFETQSDGYRIFMCQQGPDIRHCHFDDILNSREQVTGAA